MKVWLTPSEAFEGNLIRASKYPRCTPGRQNEKARYWNSREAILAYRKSWEEHVNLALERAGRPERVDCRSYKDQGLDTIPGIHLGSYASRQTDSDRYRANEEIQELNRKNEDIQKCLDEVEKEIENEKGNGSLTGWQSSLEKSGAISSLSGMTWKACWNGRPPWRPKESGWMRESAG